MDFIKRHKWEVPLYIISAGLPLIIYFHTQYTGMENLPWFPNKSTWTDFFLYGKSKCVHLTALVMAGISFVDAIRKKNEKHEKEWWLVIIFGILQLLSAFCSHFPQQSFLGEIEQYESVWVLLSYLIIGCYAYKYVTMTKNPDTLMAAIFIGVILSCMIGMTQLFQMDFFEGSLGKQLLIPGKYAQLREDLRFNFSQGGWEPVYLASYNPNYAGIYLLMVIPSLFLYGNSKIKIVGISALLCMIGTMSKTVLLVAIVIFVICFIVFKNSFTKIDTKWLFLSGTVILIFITVFFVLQRNEKLVSDEHKLQRVVCEKDYVCIVYQGETIRFRKKSVYTGGITHEILYEDGTPLEVFLNEETSELDPLDKQFEGLHFNVYEKNGIEYIMFRYGDISFRFIKNFETESYEYVNIYGKTDQIKEAKAIFKGYEEFLNGRGYIWSRTLPIIIENLLLGTGPDTFLIVFPQDEYVMRSNLGHSFFTQLITNAHSLYLHMAVQTGIPALLCFLAFVSIYMRKSWKLYFGKEKYTQLEKNGIAIFLGVIGYLLCGLTFASSVCTTPIFCVLLGTGIGINKIVAGNKNQHLSV